MKKCVVIVAGGKGLRFGSDLPKQFLPMNQKPVLMHTIDAFYNCEHLVEVKIADSVKTIESGAFYSCTNLKQV